MTPSTNNVNLDALQRYPRTAVQDHLQEATTKILALMDGLGAAHWSSPSRCEGWSVADVAQHLAEAYAIYLAACLPGARPPYLQPARPANDSEIAASVQAEGSLLLARLADLPDARLLRHPAYLVPAATLAAIALSETLLHGWDIADPLGLPWAPSADAASAVLIHLHRSQARSDNPWVHLLHVTGRRAETNQSQPAGPDWDWELISIPRDSPDPSEG